MVGACYGKSQIQVGIQWIFSQLFLNMYYFFKCVKRQVPIFWQLKNNYKIWPTSISDTELKKNCIREKKSLSTNANKHFLPKTLRKKLAGGTPSRGRNTLQASITLRKVLACPTNFGVYNKFFLTITYLIGSLPFFRKCAEEFQIDLGIFFFI